jgi:hypothetical protein
MKIEQICDILMESFYDLEDTWKQKTFLNSLQSLINDLKEELK